jgi:cell division protein FtsB
MSETLGCRIRNIKIAFSDTGRKQALEELAVATEQLERENTALKARLEVRELARHQLCGCVVCICEDAEQCQGCGARNCGTHPPGQMPNPVYKDSEVCPCSDFGSSCHHFARAETPKTSQLHDEFTSEGSTLTWNQYAMKLRDLSCELERSNAALAAEVERLRGEVADIKSMQCRECAMVAALTAEIESFRGRCANCGNAALAAEVERLKGDLKNVELMLSEITKERCALNGEILRLHDLITRTRAIINCACDGCDACGGAGCSMQQDWFHDAGEVET